MSILYFRSIKILLLLGLMSYQASAQSWEKVESLPSIWLTAVAADENRLWVAGTNKLYFTTNNTSEWDSTEIIHPELQYISDILLYEDLIFVTDEFKGIFKSEDEGQSWQNYNQGLNFTHVVGGAIRGDSIYIGTIGAGIFVRNLKLNQNWQNFSSGIHWQNTESISNINGTLVAGAGSNATLYLNKAQESTWTEVQFANFNGSPSALLASIEVDDKWIAAGNNGLYTSLDDGLTWTQLNIQTGFIGQARLIEQNDIVYAHLAKTSGPSKLYFSSDKGIIWNNFTPLINDGIDLTFWNDQMWYATQNGLWNLKTSTGIDHDTTSAPGLTAYPNPFTREIKIEIEIKTPGYYSIGIQSIAGRKAMILQEKWLESGHHEINSLTTGSLNPGLYIIKVANENSLKSIKVFKSE